MSAVAKYGKLVKSQVSSGRDFSKNRKPEDVDQLVGTVILSLSETMPPMWGKICALSTSAGFGGPKKYCYTSVWGSLTEPPGDERSQHPANWCEIWSSFLLVQDYLRSDDTQKKNGGIRSVRRSGMCFKCISVCVCAAFPFSRSNFSIARSTALSAFGGKCWRTNLIIFAPPGLIAPNKSSSNYQSVFYYYEMQRWWSAWFDLKSNYCS